MPLLTVLLSCMAVVLLVPASVLLIEVLLALPNVVGREPEHTRRPSVGVLIPAHDEATVIADTIRTILPQFARDDRLLVVADNCSDDTARIASSAGAQVIIRDEPAKRGKGYALDYGVRHLHGNPPQVVIIIDADCQVSAGAIDLLAQHAVRFARPVQALDLMQAPASAGVRVRLAQFAWIVKNQVRPLGLKRLGLPCHLMGTGMAFPWACLAEAALATGNLVEDLKLGLDFARAGRAPVFCPGARVTSTFPLSREAIGRQRTRWEHGHLSLIFREVPRLLVTSVARANLDALTLGLDLCVPPLALLALLVGMVWIGGAVLYRISGAPLPLAISSAELLMLLTAVLASWMRYGRDVLSGRELLLSIAYALAKLPIYAKFIGARQKRWVRSDRGRDGS